MRKSLFISAFLLLFPLLAGAQEASMPRLSDSAYASLITCGPGDEFYTTFGHSAIRINDSVNNIDVVYNYGTFDFDTPHFYWKFARGRLNYCLSRSSFDNFMFEYSMEGRAVWEQRLRLTSQELNNLFIALETNYMPQYRYYLYDFFRDNCATRVRDMVFHSLCHRSVSPETTTDTNLSYRNILYRSTAHCLLWWRLGIDMALGLRCDKRCSNYEYMFSPIEMMHQFDTLTVSDTRQPLADPATTLLTETRSPLPRSVSPVLLFYVLLLAVLCLTILEWRHSWNLRWFDRCLFTIDFILSLVAIFLWFFTVHYCTKINLNILWLSPLFIYFAIRLRHSNRWVVVVQLVMLFAAMVMTLGALPQQLNASVLPLALILAVRLISNLRPDNSSTPSK